MTITAWTYLRNGRVTLSFSNGKHKRFRNEQEANAWVQRKRKKKGVKDA